MLPRVACMPMLMLAAVLFSVRAAEPPKEMLLDHEVRLNPEGRLLPWAGYDHILRGSVEYLKHCPTVRTRHGEDPWYLVTSKLNPDGSFRRNQNNQGGNLWYAMETAARWRAYSGDQACLEPARLLLERVMSHHTPDDWAWPGVPRTQDNSPDGVYTDQTSEVDKICMAAAGYLRWHALTGDTEALAAAGRIAAVIAANAVGGDADHSPLPFRVNLKTGEVLDPYTSNIVAVVVFLDMARDMGLDADGRLAVLRDRCWEWVMAYPVQNHRWSGYFEDVDNNMENLNQFTPLETARYMLAHPDREPRWRETVPELLRWVEERFGRERRHGAVSLCEQDCCMKEMSSHTARFASVLAAWHRMTGDPEARGKALDAFALSTYSAFSRHSKDGRALNYVGVGYIDPWFSDSYFDYIPHFLCGMAALPEMAPAGENRLLGSTGTVRRIEYGNDRVTYEAFEPEGTEVLRVRFTPQVLADGAPMDPARWQHGTLRGAEGVLEIRRQGERRIVVESAGVPAKTP
ncbi:MAG: hypothetical protein GX580_04020 [Candidatus Hydrogenedens sp.]|nr:hypothetical protein [Candidatus Hydrogenedens sp.]